MLTSDVPDDNIFDESDFGKNLEDHSRLAELTLESLQGVALDAADLDQLDSDVSALQDCELSLENVSDVQSVFFTPAKTPRHVLLPEPTPSPFIRALKHYPQSPYIHSDVGETSLPIPSSMHHSGLMPHMPAPEEFEDIDPAKEELEEQIKRLQIELEETNQVAHTLEQENARLRAEKVQWTSEKETMGMLKTKEMGQLKVQFEERLKANEQRNSEFEQQLQDELERMKADLDEAQQLLKESQEEINRLRQENRQLIAIKGHLEQEKELDILTIKKEVLTQKERQLKEMQGEMNRKMEEMGVQYRSEKLSLEESHQHAIKLKDETIQGLRKEIQEANQRIHQFESKPYVLHTSMQTEDMSEVFELQYLKESIKKMAIKFSEWMNLEKPSLNHPALLDTIMDNVRLFAHSTRESIKQREVELLHLKEQVHHLKEATEEGSLLSDMKKQHFSELERVIQEAKREKEALIIAHEQEIQSLKCQEYQLTPTMTVESLKKMYPVQVAEVEATIEYACKSNIEQDRESYERQYKSEYTQKLKDVQEKYQKEVELITFRLKEQCSKAYDSAVAKLKGEYKKSEAALLERHAQELDHLKKHNLNTHELKELTRKCTEYQAMITNLEDSLSRTRIAHQQELHRLQETHSSTLATMKKKYISTLQSIRDEVVKGKQNSLERLESEWKKRKQKLDQEWSQRYEQLQNYYEQKL